MMFFNYRSRSRVILLVFPYIFTLLVTALTTGLLFVLRSSISSAVVALLYLLPVGMSTFLWGLGPGILAAIVAFLAFNYFFIFPYYTFFVHQTQDLLALLVFLVVAVVISQLVGRTRRSLAIATTREREAIRLYELSQSLSGLRDERGIVQAIAQQTKETFQADRVEVFVEGGKGRERINLQIPPVEMRGGDKPRLVVPLQAARGLVGEIRLWRSDPPLVAAEERLLRTISSQGALALERAWLTQTETRAKVLEESDRLKSSLLSSVSHELRTPLATIKAVVTSLHSGTIEWDSEARQELLAVLEEETDQLDRLVGNLLNMSRIEAGALQPQRRWNHLTEIVAGVMDRLRQRRIAGTAAAAHIFEVDIPEDLPLVPVDYVLMEQVFVNLISNSIKYSPEKTTIKINAGRADDHTLLIRVSNQGPGVPEEHLERIFDKFYRVTAADRVTGAGLGLSICKGIVEAHGGRIWAENLPDGFAFNFTLPINWEGAPP
ncbi:MAG TPA: ATP-binding protein, partial [Anaerolineales bacterium]|nr:ATP-binding protein [Anaerolineales bacterium]